MVAIAENYKQKLINVSELKTKGLKNLFDRVKILVEVFEDPSFRDDVGGDDFKLAEELNVHVNDCALDFLELRSILIAFPSQKSWKDVSLKELLKRVIAANKQSDDADKPKFVKRSATVKQVEELEAKLREAECRNKQLLDENRELKLENKKLIQDIGRLEGRVADLEQCGATVRRREPVGV